MKPPAMIFAAGFGTRMGRLTADTPKPMLNLGGRPMIDHSIDLLRAAGVSKIVANIHFRHEQISPHLAKRQVKAVHEERILETGGGLRAALPLLTKSPAVTMNPDALWLGPNPVEVLISAWKPKMIALLMIARDEANDHSDFHLHDGTLQRGGPYRYTGLQMLRTDWLSDISEEVFSLNLYWDYLLRRGSIHGIVYQGGWMDIGTSNNLDAARKLLAK